jgi:TrmH family RNA methyltransferase
VRRLARDGAAYRRGGQVWLEGDHLCSALRRAGHPAQALITESAWARAELRAWPAMAARVLRLPDACSPAQRLESPADIGFVLDMPARCRAR